MIELGAPGTFDVGAVHEGCGGPAPQPCKLRPELFGAAAMVEVKSDLMKMTICQLKDELAARATRRAEDGTAQIGASRAASRAHHCASCHGSSTHPPWCCAYACGELSGAVSKFDETVGAESLRQV